MRRLVLTSLTLSIAAAVAASMAVSMAACQVRGEVTGEFTCVEDPRCPDGFSCVSGTCVETDGTPAAACATTNQLSTSFDGTMLPWWADEYTENGGANAVNGGDLVMTVPANAPQAYTQVHTYAHYDLRGRALEFEVPQVGGRTTEVGLEDPSGVEVYFGMTEGKMFIYSKGRRLVERPYSATGDRWWRIRADGVNAVWETSQDGVAWNHLGTDVSPIDLAWVQVKLSMQGGMNLPAATARWAAISPTVDPAIAWCPLSSWTESMTDNMLAPYADYYGEGCTVVESGGALKVSASMRRTTCVAYSTRPLDARDSTLAMEVTRAPEPGWTRISLSDRGDRNIISMYSDDEFHFYVEANNGNPSEGTAPIKPDHRFWRIVLATPQVRFEASTDGKAWDQLFSISAPMLDASALFMERAVYVEDNGTGPLPTTGSFGARIR